jgi:hypothetical protein
MRRIVALSLLAAGLVLVMPAAQPARACTCEAGWSVGRKISESDVAFVGTGLRHDDATGNGLYRVDEPVRGVEKGERVEIARAEPAPPPGAEAVPAFGGGDCRIAPPLGPDVPVTATETADGRLTAYECTKVGLKDLREYSTARERLPLIAGAAAMALALLFVAARRTARRTGRPAIPPVFKRPNFD